jgi:hypothetical protein
MKNFSEISLQEMNALIEARISGKKIRQKKSRKAKNKPTLDKLEHLSSRSISERQKKDVLTPSAPERAEAKNAPLEHLSSENEEITTTYTRGDLGKRANNLYFSQAFKKALIKFNPKSNLLSRYKNSLSCSTILLKTEEKITSRYCGNRFCNVCNRIATGKAINKHGNTLKELTDPYFVTLTIPNVKQEPLKKTVQGMIKNFSRIIKSYQQQRKRADLEEVKGYRKIEITYNQARRDFHPHFHVIIDSQDAAEYVLKQWLRAYPAANEAAQDIKQASPKAAKELFKYVTKLLPKKLAGQTWNTFFADEEQTGTFFKAQDAIYQALNNVRTIQGFGYKQQEAELIPEEQTNEKDHTAEETKKDLKATEYENTQQAETGQYNWISSIQNWIHPETGEMLLLNHKIPPKLKNLCNLIYKEP